MAQGNEERDGGKTPLEQPQGAPPNMGNRISGMMPGGANPTNFDRIPSNVENEADYWRGHAEQLEKTVQDIGSIHQRNINSQTFWSGTSDDGGTELEDLLGHLWRRGIELAGVLAAVVFMIQIFGTDLSPLAQMSGAVAVTAFFDRYLRPIISRHI